MKIQAAKLLLIHFIFLLLLALILAIVGITGDYWMESTGQQGTFSKIYFGLMKRCETVFDEKCTKRKVLTFVASETFKYDRDLDIVLALLITAIVLGAIALLLSFTIIPSGGGVAWLAVALTIAVLSLCGGLVGIGGLAYFEKTMSDYSESLSYNHGWSSIITWVSMVFMMISPVFGFVMTRVQPHYDYRDKVHTVKTQNITTSNHGKQYTAKKSSSHHPTYDNRGYEKDVREHQESDISGYSIKNAQRNHNKNDRSYPHDRSRGSSSNTEQSFPGENRGYQSKNRGDRGHKEMAVKDLRPYEVRHNRTHIEYRIPSYDSDGYEMR